MMLRATRMTALIAGVAFAAGLSHAAAKECYAPDARAQVRAFSRAVTTEGGKTIWLGGQIFSRSLPVTKAKEIPARKRKRGAGKVPPSCEYIKKRLCRAEPPSHES